MEGATDESLSLRLRIFCGLRMVAVSRRAIECAGHRVCDRVRAIFCGVHSGRKDFPVNRRPTKRALAEMADEFVGIKCETCENVTEHEGARYCLYCRTYWEDCANGLWDDDREWSHSLAEPFDRTADEMAEVGAKTVGGLLT
jgi:hypothetical protein